MVRLLVENGADINAVNANGNTALFEAIDLGNLWKIVKPPYK